MLLKGVVVDLVWMSEKCFKVRSIHDAPEGERPLLILSVAKMQGSLSVVYAPQRGHSVQRTQGSSLLRKS